MTILSLVLMLSSVLIPVNVPAAEGVLQKVQAQTVSTSTNTPANETKALATDLASASRLNETKIALLIEMRPLNTLVPILLHFIATLADDWPFLLLHSAEVGAALNPSRAIHRYIQSGKLATVQLPAITKLSNRQDLSHFLTRNETWHLLPLASEHIFFFQLDSMICSIGSIARRLPPL
ncbi:hypothetical protein HKX48_002255 [Thoreauomyces humboldtii]|nr:hypothetical protein HKX48_002255 [Thoreauomyces humboldtii]